MFDSLPLPILVLIFAGAAVTVWMAGVKLSNTTDVLSSRFGLGEALAGLIMLAIVTNLPEIAITASAALSDNLGVAVGNILGGIALQTVVLVILDVFGIRGPHPLTYRAASLVLVLEGALVIAVLTVVVMGTQLPSSLVFERIAPGGLLIAVLWVGGLLLLNKARTGLPWQACPGRSGAKRPKAKGSHAGTPRPKRSMKPRTGEWAPDERWPCSEQLH